MSSDCGDKITSQAVIFNSCGTNLSNSFTQPFPDITGDIIPLHVKQQFLFFYHAISTLLGYLNGAIWRLPLVYSVC
jgi:hypothetical protein